MAEKHLLKMHNRLVVVNWSFTQVFCLSMTISTLAITEPHSTIIYRNQVSFFLFIFLSVTIVGRKERAKEKCFFRKFIDNWIMFDDYCLKDLQAPIPYS